MYTGHPGSSPGSTEVLPLWCEVQPFLVILSYTRYAPSARRRGPRTPRPSYAKQGAGVLIEICVSPKSVGVDFKPALWSFAPGTRVDLRTAAELHPSFRSEVIGEAFTEYVAA